MSGSDTGKLVKAVGFTAAFAIAAFSSGATIQWGLGEQAKYERRAEQNSAKEAKYTADYIRQRCVPLPDFDEIDCTAKARSEYKAYEHDQTDLVAQKTSALWALLVGCATVIGIPLSGLGILLVYTTFKETQRSADSAVQSNRSARAWIVPKNFEIEPILSRNIAGPPILEGYQIFTTFENVGSTPAIKVWVYRDFEIIEIEESLPTFQFKKERDRSKIVDQAQTVWSMPMQIRINDFLQLASNQKTLAIYAVVEYSDLFEPDEIRATELCGHIFIDTIGNANGAPATYGVRFRAMGEQNRRS